jgi:chromosome segregation ATPase
VTDEEIAELEAELAAKLNQITELQNEATEIAARLNDALNERDREPVTVHELHGL